ncbi:four helix bundle protein [Candidatus Uhrbacteria bacterium]|nr:four helix bundle protein [Candidatus Uhrbacteria bacterium]
MSFIEEKEVFTFSYEALKAFHVSRKKFSKAERYSLGEKIETALLEVLVGIIDAGGQKREWKLAGIDRALIALERAKILTRLAHDMRELSENDYVSQVERLVRVGRMLGGWRKSV